MRIQFGDARKPVPLQTSSTYHESVKMNRTNRWGHILQRWFFKILAFFIDFVLFFYLSNNRADSLATESNFCTTKRNQRWIYICFEWKQKENIPFNVMRKSTNLSPQWTSSLSQVRIRQLDHLRSDLKKLPFALSARKVDNDDRLWN